jgi:hypothetical protein
VLVLCAGTKSLTLRPPVSNACAPSTTVCREWLWNLAFLLMDVLPIRLLASLLASLLPQRLLHLAGGDPTVSGPALTPVPTVCAARFIWIVNINPDLAVAATSNMILAMDGFPAASRAAAARSRSSLATSSIMVRTSRNPWGP